MSDDAAYLAEQGTGGSFHDNCPECGQELEEDEATEDLVCPDCKWRRSDPKPPHDRHPPVDCKALVEALGNLLAVIEAQGLHDRFEGSYRAARQAWADAIRAGS